MDITPDVREQVRAALERLDMNGAELAKLIGVNRSWVTRLLKPAGGLKTLSNKHKVQLEHHLEILFDDHRERSLAAHQFDRIANEVPDLGSALGTTLHEFEKAIYGLPLLHEEHTLNIGVEVVEMIEKQLKEGQTPNPYEVGEKIYKILERQLRNQFQESLDQRY